MIASVKQNKCIFYLGCFLLIGLVSFYIGYRHFTSSVFYQYSAERDKDAIMKLFNDEFYLLTATPDYDVEYMLDTQSPHKNRFNKGKMKIYVIRENNQFVGFFTFYMKRNDLGKILFMAVHPDFRNRGYSRRAVQFSVDELKKMGAQRVVIATREEDIPAQRSYTAAGFVPIKKDHGFITYEYPF